jgi:hypothetical protein
VLIAILTRNKQARQALELEIERLKMTTKLSGLEQDRQARKAELAANDIKAKQLDGEITGLKKALVETHGGLPEGATAEDIAREFEKLGY